MGKADVETYVALVSGIAVLVLVILGYVENRVRSIVRAFIVDPDSPLSSHMRDPAAHEAMRNVMSANIDAKLNQISAQLDKQRDELIIPTLRQHEKTLDLLKTMNERERRHLDDAR